MRCRRHASWIPIVEKFTFYLTALVLFGSSEIGAQENYSSWSGHLQITINTASLGLTGNVTNFPLLIRLNPSNFSYFNQTQAGGADIRFSKINYSSHLFYEIERWADGAGNNDTAAIWVRVDTVYASTASQSIVMHFGKTGVGDSSRSGRVFDTSAGFVAVYHLEDSTGGNTFDATDNGLTATKMGPTQIGGIIGYAQHFSGSGYIKGTSAFDKCNFGSIFTATAWVYLPGAVSSPGALWSKGNDNTTWEVQETQCFLGDNTTTSNQVGRYPMFVGGTRGYLNGPAALDTSSWHQITFVYNSSGPVRQLYIDGKSSTPSRADYASGTDNAGNILFIGRDISGECNNDFNGRMDEMEVSKVVRSADWIRLAYESQRLDQTILGFSMNDEEDYATWPYHVNITINTSNSGGGSNVTQPVYNFPLSIQINPSNFVSFGQVADKGADIRFAKSNGIHLPYEIERWVDGASNNDTAEIWVRMDTVRASNASQYITMYWGKSGAASRSDPHAVFDVPTGFAGAWHLNEAPGAAGSIMDRTSNAYNGTPAGGMSSSSSVNGVVGKALDFDGIDDNIVLPAITTDFTGGITISGWMQFHTFKKFSRLMDFSENGQANDNIFVVNLGTSNGLRFGLLTGSTQNLVDTSGIFTANAWDYVTCVYTGAEQAVYRNGTLVKSVARTNALANVTRTTNYIARSNWPTDEYYDGFIDELQVSRIARSPSWIKLAFETQKPGRTSVCYAVSITKDPTDTAVTMGDTARCSVVAAGNNIVYQWQRRHSEGSWSNVTSGVGGTTASYKFVTALDDTNSLARCIVSNCGGIDTSGSALLTVCVPLTITTQPQPATITVGDTATFGTAATGRTLAYQWQRSTGGGAWSNVPSGGTAATYKFKTDSSDTNRLFRCMVTGNCGFRDSTRPAALALCYTVIITTQPVNQTVNAGRTATFSVAAQAGGKALSYQWSRNDGSGWMAVTGANSANYPVTAVSTDNRAQFRCAVTLVTGCGTAATSAAATLTICTPPLITAEPSDSRAKEGDSAAFTVAATGTAPTYQWWRSDDSGSAWTVLAGQTSATYKFLVSAADTGNKVQFRCMVTGCGVTDTSKIVRIGRCFSVKITKHPDSATVAEKAWATFRVVATGTGLRYQWERSDNGGTTWAAFSGAGATSEACSLQVESAANGALFRCVIHDSCATSATSRAALLTVCAPVSIADTLLPKDTTVTAGDTARFTVSAAGTSVSYQWQRSANNGSSWSPLSGATSPLYRFKTDTADTQTLYRCVASGLCGSSVSTRGARLTLCFTITITQHPSDAKNIPSGQQATFSVRAGGMRLSYQWEKSTDGGKIWAAIAGAASNDYRLTVKESDDGSKYRCVVSNACGGVNSNAATLTVYQSTVANTIKLRDVRFDTSTNHVWISWNADTTVGSNLQIGISYGVGRMTPQDSSIKKVVDVDAKSDSAEIILDDELLFDTTFTFYLWLRKSGETWNMPTDESSDTVRIPSFVWQSVRYSVRYLVDDTTRWVNGRVRFITNKVFSKNDAQNYVGKIRRYDGDSAGLRGLIVVGQTFRFVEKQSSVPLAVGLKCYGIPSGYTLRDVRMYRWNGDYWMLDRSTVFDTANRVIAVRTNELEAPFAAMIDTLHPKMTVLNHKRDSLERDREVRDTILVSDNIGNLIWSFRCAQGDKSLASSDSSQRATLTKTSDTARVIIARRLVNEENGVRAAFIASDGRFTDTMVLSRRVIRERSDVTPIARELCWVPLRVTAELDSPDVKRLWRLVDTTASASTYDTRKIRLFRWQPHPSNAGSDQKWLEYAGDRDGIFAFRPGRLFWVKLRSTAEFQFGRALTMPLDDTVEIPLNSGDWTDFALPFRFDIRIGDILAATRSRFKGVDSLLFYRWDTTKTTYKASPFYLEDLKSEDIADPSAAVSSQDRAGYTVYNPSTQPISLRIPPIPLALSTIGKVQKTARTGGWSIRVSSRVLNGDGCELPPVYCLYAPARGEGEKYLPMPPGFQEVSVGVYEEKAGRVRGHKILRSLTDGGGAFLLAFTNSGKNERTIQFNLDRLGALPDNFKTAMYDPLKNEVTDISDRAEAVTLQAMGSEYRWVFVGGDGYIGSAAKIRGIGTLAFLKPYPNPVRGFVQLRYTLPFASVSRVDFTILDIRGRIVWRKTVQEKSVMGGGRSCIWNGVSTTGRQCATGLYVVKLTAFDLKYKPLRSFDERITIIR